MNNSKLILVALFFSFQACEESIKFEVPQPPGADNLNSLPKSLWGTYFSNADSTFLTIDAQRIVEWIDLENRTVLDSLGMEIDSTLVTYSISDTIQLTEGMFDIRLKFLPMDSVIIFYSYRDTVFEISEKQILRKYRGYYFLNYERKEKNWNVRRLTLIKGELSFSKVRITKDISELRQITGVEELKTDSGTVVGYRLNPTRRELKELMKHSFSETATYQKLK